MYVTLVPLVHIVKIFNRIRPITESSNIFTDTTASFDKGHSSKIFFIGHIKEMLISYDQQEAIQSRILSSIFGWQKREGIVIRFAFCTNNCC